MLQEFKAGQVRKESKEKKQHQEQLQEKHQLHPQRLEGEQ